MATQLQGTQPIIPPTVPHPLAGSLRKVEPKRLSLSLLIALVVGSMIGSGIFSLPQNMAASAGAGAILIGWLITGVGMLSLALVYQTLSNRQPALDNGVFAYARALGGEFLGFNSAWGYWISAWIGNVSYLVILFAALSYFFPLFGEGNNKAAIAGASVVLWSLHWMILRGTRTAAWANALTTIAKIVPLLLFIGLVIAAFQKETFTVDFWGSSALGSTLDQVKSTMLVTVWVFIGIEGANVFSARAAERAQTYAGHRGLQLRDMAIASVATLYCLWLLYAAGPKYMLLSALLYAPGSLIYLATMKSRQGQPLSGPETGLLIIIWTAAAFAGWMLWSGTLAL